MNLLLLPLLVLPFACLALLSFVAFLGVAAIAGALHLMGVTRSALGIAEQKDADPFLTEHSAMRTRSTTWRLRGSGQPRLVSCHHQNRMRDGEDQDFTSIDRHVCSRLRHAARYAQASASSDWARRSASRFSKSRSTKRARTEWGPAVCRRQPSSRCPRALLFLKEQMANLKGRTVALPRTPTSTSLPPARKGCGSLKHSRE